MKDYKKDFAMAEALDIYCKKVTDYCEDFEAIDPNFDYYRHTNLEN